MATINLTLDTRRKKKDGTYPLVFRLRANKKFSDIPTGISVTKNKFNIKTLQLINDDSGNQLLDQLRTRYSQRLREYKVNQPDNLDLQSIRLFVLNKVTDEITVKDFWLKEISSLETKGRLGNARTYKITLNALTSAIQLNVPFKKITYKDLLDLEDALYKRGMKPNGISVYMRTFRALCNKAIDQDIVGFDWYPFKKFKIRKEKTTPRVISLEEMRSYFDLNLDPTDTLYQSWQIGKLIFMMRGINLKDLLLLSSHHIKSDRVIYKRSKTGKLYSVRITSEIQSVLACFASGETLIGELNKNNLSGSQKSTIIYEQKRKVVNNHLNKIGKLINSKVDLSTYVFRYSYANIAKQLGYSKDLIAEALGHEYGNSVTGIYLEQFDLEIVDQMNQNIIASIINEGAFN